MVFEEARKFVAPEFVFGVDTRRLAGQYARNLSARKVLLVTDPGVMRAGWTEDVGRSLDAHGIAHAVFAEVTPNPKDHEVMAGVEAYRAEGCNAIVAVGGGSPMDCAKGIGIAVSNERHVLTFEGVDEVRIPGPPLICIPTTAGTAADVSQFAIITDTRRRVKIAIVSKAVVPDVALIDPMTTTSMDEALTATTGMDALAHGLEAVASNASSPITDLHALEALRLIPRALPAALEQPANLDRRSWMTLASLQAGLAFSNSGLGAVHAMAHALGGLVGAPHGGCNAILLHHVVRFNFDAARVPYRRAAAAMGLAASDLDDDALRAALVTAVDELAKRVRCARRLRELAVSREDLPAIARVAMRDPCMATNPMPPTLDDARALLELAY